VPIQQSTFQPAWWLPGAHAQTLYPHQIRRVSASAHTRERLELPDGDFVDLDWAGPESGGLVCLFHGLEGSGESNYIRGLTHALTAQGLRSVLMHFRGCSHETNRLARSYHSGDTGDIRFLIHTLRTRHPGRLLAAVGFSLGGNALLKFLGEEGPNQPLDQAVAVSVPFDLAACADRLSSGISRLYCRHLLASLHAKVASRATLIRAAGVDVDAALASRDFWEFDQAVVAPIFGFKDAADYYTQSSCGPFLQRIEVPTLILHAADDPFMTPEAMPSAKDLSPAVTLEISQSGGHVGFVAGPAPGLAHYWLDDRIAGHLGAIRAG